MTLNPEQIQSIVMLSGLGYNQQEVANKINCSRATIAHHLNEFKKEAEENGIYDAFWSYFSTDTLYDVAFARGKRGG